MRLKGSWKKLLQPTGPHGAEKHHENELVIDRAVSPGQGVQLIAPQPSQPGRGHGGAKVTAVSRARATQAGHASRRVQNGWVSAHAFLRSSRSSLGAFGSRSMRQLLPNRRRPGPRDGETISLATADCRSGAGRQSASGCRFLHRPAEVETEHQPAALIDEKVRALPQAVHPLARCMHQPEAVSFAAHQGRCILRIVGRCVDDQRAEAVAPEVLKQLVDVRKLPTARYSARVPRVQQ